jgi:hypothetical protein
MSTILEMAEIVRAGESRPANDTGNHVRVVDVYTRDRVTYLCDLFETSPWGLCCAIESVGSDPTSIDRFLRSRRAVGSMGAVASE